MGTPGFPDINGFYAMLYGTAGVDYQSLTIWQFGGASGLVFSGNPLYTVTDFLGMYPKFFGPSTQLLNATIIQGSAVVALSVVTGLAPAQLIVSSSFPKDTLIESITGNNVTMTNVATANGGSILAYEAPFIPIAVVMAYVLLARYSVMSARYFGVWPIAMALFIAHYCTMYMRTESSTPNATASQVASSGLTKGILVHRGAGDVSATSQLVQGLEEFGAWNETEYGVQFATLAQGASMGPIWVQ